MKRALILAVFITVAAVAPVSAQVFTAANIDKALAPTIAAAQDTSEPQVSDTALTAVKWTFVGVQSIACGYGIAKAAQQGEDVLQKVTTCASATAGALVASEYIKPRWLRFVTLGTAAAVTGYVNGKAIFADIKAAKK